MPKLNRFQNRQSSSSKPTKDKDKYSIVMVGCGGVGKSSITLRFVYNEFEDLYDPTQADSYRKSFDINENGIESESRLVEIDILDTAGQEEYAAIRDSYYRSGDGFLLVFSINDQISFKALPDFISQISRSLNDPNPPILVIGNKADLSNRRTISEIEAQGLVEKSSRYAKYRETSAKTGFGINEAFAEIVKLIEMKRMKTNLLIQDKTKKKRCTIQ